MPRDQKWLRLYLQDHDAGGVAGRSLARRIARGHSSPRVRAQIAAVGADIEADHSSLRSIMRKVGVRPNHLKRLGAAGVERAGRLLPNGRLRRRSPLSDLIELEALLTGINAKAMGWQALLAYCDMDQRLDRAGLNELVSRAEQQRERVEHLRREVARTIFAQG